MDNLQKTKSLATGTRADLEAKVKMSKVHNGYFSNSNNAQAFVEIGIMPILSTLPHTIEYSDFGGGEGYLGNYVSESIKNERKIVNTTIVDANPEYLKKARELKLKTIEVNLQDCQLNNLDLITMRAVNHYNNIQDQARILENTVYNLKKGGYLVSQISTGNDANVNLRSAICNLQSLGRASHNDQYQWITTENYIEMLKCAKFSEIKLAGYAPSNSWSPEEQYERFNTAKRKEANKLKNKLEIVEIEKRKRKFVSECKLLIESNKFQNAGTTLTETGNYVIPYQYAIIIARK